VRTIRELETALDKATGRVKVEVVRFRSVSPGVVFPEVVPAELELLEGSGIARLGAERGDTFVWEVKEFQDARPGKSKWARVFSKVAPPQPQVTPAWAMGMRVGDQIVSVGGQKVHSVGALEDRMALAARRQLEITWLSGGQLKQGTVGPFAPEGDAKYCGGVTDFGVRFGAPRLPVVPLPGETVTITFGPVEAMEASFKKLPEGIMLIGKILAKLPTGEVPLESMGGPLQIAQVASQTAEQGLDSFLSAMALVSVNLALVNLLPIPILDGFNILIALWEAIRRRPPSMRVRELTTYFGFAVLALLMVIAFRNDIARLLFC
jgi:RIP metalloprotease RseP